MCTLRQTLFGFGSTVWMLTATAGELVQSYVNPDFGGSPLNGSYLLSNAAAQNEHTVKPTPTTTSSSRSSKNKGGTGSTTDNGTAAQFAKQVDSLVVSALAYRLVNKAFGGQSGLPDNSTINDGVNTISVQSNGSGTTVTIVDNVTGGKSIINIPNY